MSLDQIEVWGVELPAKGKVEVPSSEAEGVMEITHVTNCALGENPKDGSHVVKVVVESRGDGTPKPVVLGTLSKGSCYQFPVDFGFCQPTTFINTGSSAVFLTGYRTTSFYEDEDEDFSQDEYETDEDEDEDEEAPLAVPLTMANGKISDKKGSRLIPGTAAAAESSDEDEDEDEDEEEDEEEDEDEEESSEEEEPAVPAKQQQKQQQQQPRKVQPVPMDVDSDDEDEDDEEDDDEDEDESEDEESSEEEEEVPVKQPKAAPAAVAGAKRPPQTPQAQPAKKQKAAAAPASAPPKMQGAGDAERTYVAALVSTLKESGGTMTMSALASKMPRPDTIKDKFKAFIIKHSETFDFDGNSLKITAK